jgi:hypothetical protein
MSDPADSRRQDTETPIEFEIRMIDDAMERTESTIKRGSELWAGHQTWEDASAELAKTNERRKNRLNDLARKHGASVIAQARFKAIGIRRAATELNAARAALATALAKVIPGV